MVKIENSKIDFIRGKKYVFKMFMYYLNFRMKEKMPNRVIAMVEVGISIGPRLNNIVYFSATTEFIRVDGVYKLKIDTKLEKILNERFTIKELFKKVEENLN